MLITHCDIPRGSYPQTFDANRQAFEGPVIHVTEATGGEWFGINSKKVGRNHIGGWKCSVSCAHASEFTQTLSGSGTRRIETVKSLLGSLSVELEMVSW